jgi:hypothetical protein
LFRNDRSDAPYLKRFCVPWDTFPARWWTPTARPQNDDGTRSQRKSTRTPTHHQRDSLRYPSPTIANFDLRRRVHAGASYMLACSCRRPSLPVVCLLSRCPWSRKNGVDMVVAAKVHSGIESCLRGVCTLAIGNGMAYCIGRY